MWAARLMGNPLGRYSATDVQRTLSPLPNQSDVRHIRCAFALPVGHSAQPIRRMGEADSWYHALGREWANPIV
jgi:hypothetical protein